MHLPTETGNNISSAGINCVLRLVDPFFGQADTLQYITSILFTGDGCFISVHDKETRTFHVLLRYQFGLAPGEVFSPSGYESYRKAAMATIKAADEMGISMRNPRVAFASTRNTLVPGSFYNADTAARCFELNYTAIQGEALNHEYIRALDAYNIYSIPPVVQDVVSGNFPGVALHSVNGVVINSLLIDHAGSGDTIMLADIAERNLKIMVSGHESLIYCNDFEVNTIEDVVYYIVFVSGQINPAGKIPLWLSGGINEGSRTHELLISYLENAAFIEKPQGVSLAPVFRGISWHNFFTVFTVALCES
ncbi:MAG TPA: DUF3822 family protein [Bacteroidales bacterium]|nr:DUF3822 family protein [Bacteroidales bacterium]HPT02234.1 DUF3822 family protein [Bacteroidales bacterium]